MNAVRQSCRPKHQVLILKCYPKFQKNNTDVKPNSSELSYLLYYASTRRSKLQKVGDFLDKRTVSDVWKGRIGNVQVTLEILKALVEKCPRDLPLYAGALLRIFKTILRSNDITLLESSLPTWDTFCAHQDPATLAADQDYIRQFEEIVQTYAQFAAKEPSFPSKTPVSYPVAVRYRKAGLNAIKSVAASEALASETSRQLSLIIPVILINIYSTDGDYLEVLERREAVMEERKEGAYGHRRSLSTATAEPEEIGDPLAASATTEDADRLSEEEVGVVALQALRHIFVAVSRGQLRLATSAVLQFIAQHVKPHEHFPGSRSERQDSWPTSLFALICKWAPVQDRYTVLVTTMETLVRSPIKEEDLDRQLVLALIISWLLGSPFNFIGLSIIDVLIGLIQHILLLLQLGGQGTNVQPHHQQDIGDTPRQSKIGLSDRTSTNLTNSVVVEAVKEASPARVELLEQLRLCIGNLATHVYYSDQISDMIHEMLARLKPPTISGPSTAEAIGDPNSAADAIANSVSLHEDSATDAFFSFDTARITALAAIKDVLVVANSPGPEGKSSNANHSRVPISVWDGTQWLLSDPNGKVRKAYVDALTTWLRLETNKSDMAVDEDKAERKEGAPDRSSGFSRRAVSSGSRPPMSPPKKPKSSFLQLLHLAVYEDAHKWPENEDNILLLHYLLSSFVEHLGVNAAKSGLPMILRLQEDIPELPTPLAKVHIGSLVHGYLWAVVHTFQAEDHAVGEVILDEIKRRKAEKVWVERVSLPPLSPEEINIASKPPSRDSSAPAYGTAPLHPFDARPALIDAIAAGYNALVSSPPASPPASPGRSFSVPILSSPVPTPDPPTPSRVLPTKTIETLLSDWSRETCIATAADDSPSSASISGSPSRHTRLSAAPNLTLNIPGASNGTMTADPTSPQRALSHRSMPRPTSAVAFGQAPHPKTPKSTSSVRSGPRVEDLKRVLSARSPRPTTAAAAAFSLSRSRSRSRSVAGRRRATTAGTTATATTAGARDDVSSGSDSLMSVGGLSVSEFSVAGAGESRDGAGPGGAGEEDVPPVPPLPKEYESPMRRTKGVLSFLEGIDVDGEDEEGEEEGDVGVRPPY